MTAASYSQEVLQALLIEIREFQRNPQWNNNFLLVQSDFNEWLRVWKMTIPDGEQASKDLFVFQKKTKSKFVDLVKNEIRDLKSAKVSFEIKIMFTKENFETGVTQEMEHYFKEKQPHVFNEHNKNQIKQEVERFIERSKGQIEAWSERGSGWVFERITVAYVNVARYQPLRGGTYLPLPANLAKKKAIINVQNRDNECLKWALRAALFPPSDGKNPQRTSKYPVNDGVNYEGIVFPTPVKQIDKLEAQNSNLAINVFGWEDNLVIVHRISKKEKNIPRINLMLIESGLIQHYCYVKRMRAPYVIYADFEALVRKISGCELGPESKQKSYTEKTEQHEACGFAYTVVRSDGRNKRPVVYRGENAVEVFLNCLQEEEKTIRNSLSLPKPLVMTSVDWEKFKNATDCHICEKSLIKDYFLDSLPVWKSEEGSEYTYDGQWHKKCFYNAKKEHDSSFLMLKRLTEEEHKEAAEEQDDCLCCGQPLLRQNFRDAVKDHCHITGKYRGAAHNACNLKMRIKPKTDQMPVVFHNLRGYDAHHLMQAMSKLSQATQKEVKCVANNMEKYITFSFGGLRFIDSLNFLQGSLDSLLSYSKLNDDHITDEEYDHAKRVWEAFGCKTLGDYHDLYVQTDVALLADVFENFRKICLEQYRLDPANYFTSPGLSWDALLKKTGVELELLTEVDMHLFIERGLRGGISMVSKRYAKANNPYVEGFDPSKPKKYIMYLDANNLYGWAMSKPLPKSGFRWKKVMPTEKEIMRKKEFAKTGWILEVDLEYPAELHEEHNSYPLAPEKKKINTDLFSPYQKELIKNLDLDQPDSEKLVLTLEDKTNYVVHYRNLQFYLKQGMKLKKVHRVLEFEQECWMEPYIKMNTEFRKKAKNDFEKNFYKLMNNSVFGKTMENLRNRVDIKIARSDETNKIRKLVASPLYTRHILFSNDLVGIDMRKSRLFLNKPVYTGMTILDVSKILMYDFFLQRNENGVRAALRAFVYRH
ncbi:hypothetical protein ACROYT_G044596 [Oculina patagonica]